jgi:uncharacterized protein YyaL (SSP411 family)
MNVRKWVAAGLGVGLTLASAFGGVATATAADYQLMINKVYRGGEYTQRMDDLGSCQNLAQKFAKHGYSPESGYSFFCNSSSGEMHVGVGKLDNGWRSPTLEWGVIPN